MSYNGQFNSDDGFYQSDYTQNQGGGYDMGGGPQYDFKDNQFGSFDYSQSGYETRMYSAPPGGGYTGSIMTPDPVRPHYSQNTNYENFEDEPPLLEELGINFDHIVQKRMADETKVPLEPVSRQPGYGSDYQSVPLVEGQTKPDNYMVISALVCLFCNPCCGIGALYHSFKVNSSYDSGDAKKASYHSRKSWICNIVGFVFGMTIFILLFLAMAALIIELILIW